MSKRSNGSAKARPHFYNVQGAAAKLGRSESTIADAINRGDLKAAAEYRGSGSVKGHLIAPRDLKRYRDALVKRESAFKGREETVAALRAARI